MKLVIPAVTLVLLSACSSQPHSGAQSQHAASSTATTLDFSGLREQTMTVEQFLKTCQRISGYSFTYTSATQTALAAKSMRFEGQERVPTAEFPEFLAVELGRVGFASERAGPEHLRVFLIQQR
jgi:hypothetical protein